MNVENPAALRFIMQDDIYLLNSDKTMAAVAPPKAEAPVVQTPQISFNYLGGNKKNLLVLTHYTNAQFIADEHLIALENILKRKDHAIEDIAILNMANQTDQSLDQLQAYFKPVRLLVLGTKAMPANMETLPLNQLKATAACMFLYSFSFEEMMSSTDNKKAFWDQMKNL